MENSGVEPTCAIASSTCWNMGLEGVIHGKTIKTTLPDKAEPCPLDKVNRPFRVPAPA